MGVLKQQKELLSACFTVILNRYFVGKKHTQTNFQIMLEAALSTLPCKEINQKLGVLRF